MSRTLQMIEFELFKIGWLTSVDKTISIKLTPTEFRAIKQNARHVYTLILEDGYLYEEIEGYSRARTAIKTNHDEFLKIVERMVLKVDESQDRAGHSMRINNESIDDAHDWGIFLTKFRRDHGLKWQD